MKTYSIIIALLLSTSLQAQRTVSDLVFHRATEGKDFIEVQFYTRSNLYNQFEVIRTDGKKANSLGKFANRFTIKDTTFFFYNDRKVESGKLYQYVFIPIKTDGAKGVASEAVLASTKNFNNYFFRKTQAQSASNKLGIRLSWRLSSLDNVKSIEIFRSEKSEEGFERLSTVASTDTFHIDEAIVPDRIYYYYLRGQNFVTSETFESGIFFDRGMPTTAPLAPTLQGLVQTNWGVQAKVQLSEAHLANVQLLRRKTGEEKFQVVSSALVADSVVMMTDSNTVAGAYEYSAKAENLSRMSSAPGNAVGITLLSTEAPDYTGSLEAIFDFNNVKLFWENGGYVSFKVKRTELSSKRSVWLNNEMPIHGNRYTDKEVEPGMTYEYVLYPLSDLQQTGKGVSTVVTTASDPLITNETLRGSSSSKGVVLQWGAIADLRVKSQKLFRYQPGSKAVSLVTLPINQLSYTDVSAKSGELYRYFLVSVDANGKEGIPGNEIAVRAQ